MRLKDGNDLFLLVGVWLALFVVVSRPLGRLMALAFEADESYGQQLLSALVILAVVLTIHQMRKRHEARVEAQSSATTAEQAVARVAEMENLLHFGQALGESLTLDSIADVSAKHFPLLSGRRPAWAMIRSGTSWRRLAVTGDRAFEECEKAARFALGDTGSGAAGPPADLCFPIDCRRGGRRGVRRGLRAGLERSRADGRGCSGAPPGGIPEERAAVSLAP